MVGTLSGADVSIDSVREAARANPWATYRAYDGAHLPYAAASFDIAWTSCVLHHVPLAARGDLVAEMRRVTRPGGIVCIVEHNPFNPLTRLAVLRCPFDADAILLRAGETRALLTQAGLAQIALRHFLLLPATGRLVDATEQSLEALPLGAQYVALGSVPA
jgi:SAM-dependent methyltransferase